MQKKEFDILDNLELDFENDDNSNENTIIFEEETSIDYKKEIKTLETKKILLIEKLKNFKKNILNIKKRISKVKIGKTKTTETKKGNKIFSSFVFFIKYLGTSSLIFAILLFTTNYSAYTNIIKSYIFKEELKTESIGILNSVEASNIKEKFKDEIIKKTEKDIENEKENFSDLSLRKLVNASNKNELDINIEITPFENRIVIPAIGKNIPLIDIKNQKIEGYSELNDIFMKELEEGVIRYPGSSKPGEDGITFIFGHSSNFPWVRGDYNDVFALLDNVEFDDEVIIYYGQKKYKYKIKEKKVITPGDVSVLKRDKRKSELSLMTCWPLGTTLNRLIVTGELIEE